MKKLILSLGLMFAATFALTNCAKNDEPTDAPVLNGPKYELFATPADTRTTNDGLATKWASGDQINVFHAVAGSTTYKNDKAFTIDNIESGHFTGTLAETLTDGTAYDWYLFYPYNKYITTPANDSAGRVYIGGRSDTPQKQTGNNSMSHIAGDNCPMYAKVESVAYPDHVTATMNHLASVIAVEVTNTEADPITVTGISFTAPESIVGQYYINFAEETPKYTEYTYVEPTVELNVANGDAIPQNGVAKFYMLIKPFTAASGSTLSLTIKTDKGNCTKELPLTSDVAFTAGRIKTLKIGFVAPEVDTSKWVRVTSLSDITEGQYVMVAKTNTNTGYLTAKTNTTGAPTYTAITLSDDESEITSVVSEEMYFNFAGTTEGMTITNAEGKYLYMFDDNNGVRVGNTTFTWTIKEHSATDMNVFAFSGLSTRYLGVYNNQDWRCYTSLNHNNFTKTGSSKIYLYRKDVAATPTIIAKDIADVPAAGVENATATITLKGLDGVTVNAVADGAVVTAASVEGNTLTYTVSANETSEAREGLITLSADGAADVTIKVAQLAKEAVTLTLSTDAVELEATETESDGEITFTATDGATITITAYNNADGTGDCSWLSADKSGTNGIYYLAEANTGAERVAYIIVTATLDGYSITKTIKVTQKAAAGALKECTLTITASDFTTKSYTDNNGSHNKTDSEGNSIEYTTAQIMLSSNLMQWQKNKGYLYNTTDLGELVSLTIDNITAGSFTVYEGTSSQPDKTSVAATVDGKSNTYTFSAGQKYFMIKNGILTKCSSITITYKK